MRNSSIVLVGAALALMTASAQACDGRPCTEEELLMRSDQVHAPRRLSRADRGTPQRGDLPPDFHDRSSPAYGGPYAGSNRTYPQPVLPQERAFGRRGVE